MAPANNLCPLYVADSCCGDVRKSGQKVAQASFVAAEMSGSQMQFARCFFKRAADTRTFSAHLSRQRTVEIPHALIASAFPVRPFSGTQRIGNDSLWRGITKRKIPSSGCAPTWDLCSGLNSPVEIRLNGQIAKVLFVSAQP